MIHTSSTRRPPFYGQGGAMHEFAWINSQGVVRCAISAFLEFQCPQAEVQVALKMKDSPSGARGPSIFWSTCTSCKATPFPDFGSCSFLRFHWPKQPVGGLTLRPRCRHRPDQKNPNPTLNYNVRQVPPWRSAPRISLQAGCDRNHHPAML